MKKVISVQAHVIERRDGERRRAATVSVNLDQLRGAGILLEGPSYTIAAGRKDGASVLPDPQNPGFPVGIRAGAFFHSNPQKDTLFVSTNLADETGQRVVWTVPMPAGFQLEDVKLGPSSKTVYLVLKSSSEGSDHLYSMAYDGVSSPQSTSITGTKLRWLRPDGGKSDLNYMIEDDTRLRVFNSSGNLTDTGISVDCGTHISIKSTPYTTFNMGGLYLGLPEKNVVVFIPQSKLASLSPGVHPMFQSGTQDACNLSTDLAGSTVFKFGDGSAAGTSLGIYNLGPSSANRTLLVGQPGQDKVAFLNNVQNGLCNSGPPALEVQGPDGFGTLIGPSINVNDHYSPVTRAEMIPIGAFSALEESINLIPLDNLKGILAQGGNVSVSLLDTVKIIGKGLGTGSYVYTEADSIGAHGSNNFIIVIPVDPTKQAMNLIFENSVEGVNSTFVSMVLNISNGVSVPIKLATLMATSQNPITDLPTQNILTSPPPPSSSSTLTPSRTTSTVLAGVTSVTLALTPATFQQIENNSTDQSSSSRSSGGLALPYLLLVIGVGIIILVLLVIAAKVSRRSNATHHQNPRPFEEGGSSRTVKYNGYNPNGFYEEIDVQSESPPIPTSDRPKPTSVRPTEEPLILESVPVALYDSRTLQSSEYDSATSNTEYVVGTALYAVGDASIEDNYALATDRSKGGHEYDRANRATNGYLDVDPK
ncbi:MAG: hypothetical protein EXS67_05570 [Candidatus Margulisbacteria bacterium]|nr:hypothetical protein [Candidatus Margulisiibacteriota bacterium]